MWGAIAAVTSIYGAWTQSQAADEAGRAKAAAARRNAEYLRKQAEYAEAIGNARKMAFQEKATRFRSNQTSMYARGGVDLAGSVLNKLGETSTKIAQQLDQIEWTTQNEVMFANAKARESLLTAESAMGAIGYQQSAAWAQGIGGMAKALSNSQFGAQISTGVGNYFGQIGTGFANTLTQGPGNLWDAMPTYSSNPLNPFGSSGTGLPE